MRVPYGLARKVTTHHDEFALAVLARSHNRGQLIGKYSGQRRKVARLGAEVTLRPDELPLSLL